MKLSLALALISTFVLLDTKASLACVCEVSSVAKSKKQSEAVFLGTAGERVWKSEGKATVWVTKFTVERYWKGGAVSEITVYTGPDDCHAWFEPGHRYLVFAYYDKENKRLETNVCMGNVSPEFPDRYEEVLKKLGKGKTVAARQRQTAEP